MSKLWDIEVGATIYTSCVDIDAETKEEAIELAREFLSEQLGIDIRLEDLQISSIESYDYE